MLRRHPLDKMDTRPTVTKRMMRWMCEPFRWLDLVERNAGNHRVIRYPGEAGTNSAMGNRETGEMSCRTRSDVDRSVTPGPAAGRTGDGTALALKTLALTGHRLLGQMSVAVFAATSARTGRNMDFVVHALQIWC